MTALEPCPSPECGSGDASVVEWFGDGWKTEVAYVRCGDCGMHGPHVDVAAPVSQADIDAAIDEARRLWNALPRARQGTGKPPRPGRYVIRWWRESSPVILVLTEWDIARDSLWDGEATCWYGPIPDFPIPQPAERSDL